MDVPDFLSLEYRVFMNGQCKTIGLLKYNGKERGII